MTSTISLVDRLAIYLAAYKHYLEFKTCAGLLDAAMLGEAAALDIARVTFGYTDLENLNLQHNYPAVDLGTKSGDCAIQVTVTSTSTKIAETQEKFFEHGIMEEYSKLKFIILGEKQGSYESQRIIRSKGDFTFDPEKDIFDLNDLFSIVAKGGDAVKLQAFADRIEQELSDKIRPFLIGVDRPGQNLRRLFDAHDVSIANAVEPLKKFGITRDIFSNSMKLSEAADSVYVMPYVAEQFSVARNWIAGTSSHIYCEAPGAESDDWRRSLEGACQLIQKCIDNSEELMLLIPDDVGLDDLDLVQDVVDVRGIGYKHFFLVARKKNDFGEFRYRMARSEPLSYKGTKDGIFLLFLAAEIHHVTTQTCIYIRVLKVPRDDLLRCYFGDLFLVDLMRGAAVLGNQKDFINATNNDFFALRTVSTSTVSVLQKMLKEFAARQSLPVKARLRQLST